MTLTHRQALLFSLTTGVPEFMHLPVPLQDALLCPVTLRDYQLDVLRRAAALMRQGYRRVLIVLPTGGGKCLGRGTPVMMYDGRIKPAEEIVVGDLLMGPDSKPRRVLSTCTGREEMFRVTPNKGDSYVVNRSHILSLRLTGGVAKTPNPGKQGGNAPGKIINVSVDEYLRKSTTFKHLAKGWRTGVDFPPQAPCDIDPYFLGLWLGDGHSRTSAITTVDPEVVDYIYDFAAQNDLKVRVEQTGNRCPIYFINTGVMSGGALPNRLLQALQANDLIRNKHIPHVFKTASRAERLLLLAGLVDSDGHLGKNGQYDFIFKSERLARDAVFIGRSLGFGAYVTECRKTCVNNGKEGTYWRFSLTGDVDSIPVKVRRKKSGPREQRKNVLNVGISVESIGEGDYFGFEIDGDHLFLLGDFTVTHNTVLASEALRCARQIDATGQFIVHRKELIDQTSRSFLRAGLPHGFIASGRDYDPAAQTTLAGVQTLVNRLDLALPPDLVIVDEAHHSSAATWGRVFDAYPDSYMLGLTATPQRLDGRGLDKQFDAMVIGPSVAELIARGFLSAYDYFAPSRPDMTGVRTDEQAERIMDQPDLIGNMVEHYQRLALGQPGIVFAHSVKHSRHLVDAFAAEGIRAAHIDGDMSDKERERVDEMFRARDVDVLSNCALLGEGYDVPGVVYCGLARRTQSLSWFRQMVGRALRPIYAEDFGLDTDGDRLTAIAVGPKPAAIICDHASNVFTHGFPDDDVAWTLEGRAGKQKAACNDDAEPVRQCLTCYRVYPSSEKACPGCGATATPTPREIRIKEGELQKLEREAAKKRQQAIRKAEEQACTCYADFYELAVARGYARAAGWARMRADLKQNYRGRR